MNDVIQYEHQYIIQTKTRHRTPIVRTTSITNVDENQRSGAGTPGAGAGGTGGGASSPSGGGSRMHRIKRASMKRLAAAKSLGERRESGSSTPDVEAHRRPGDSESSDFEGKDLLTYM